MVKFYSFVGSNSEHKDSDRPFLQEAEAQELDIPCASRTQRIEIHRLQMMFPCAYWIRLV